MWVSAQQVPEGGHGDPGVCSVRQGSHGGLWVEEGCSLRRPWASGLALKLSVDLRVEAVGGDLGGGSLVRGPSVWTWGPLKCPHVPQGLSIVWFSRVVGGLGGTAGLRTGEEPPGRGSGYSRRGGRALLWSWGVAPKPRHRLLRYSGPLPVGRTPS